MIELLEAGVRGRSRPRLRSVSLQLEPGRVYGLIGPNGAGKSSLLSVLAGLLPLDSGELSGAPWQRGAPVGTVFSDSKLHPGRSVGETLRLRAGYLGLPSGDVALIGARVGLDSVMRRRVNALSLGMKVRLALGAALIGQPMLVLLDEPMNGLDPDGMAFMKSVLDALRRDGVTVVVSSHFLEELESLVDAAIVMSQGCVVEMHPLREAVQSRSRVAVGEPGPLLEALRQRSIAARAERGQVIAEVAVADLVRLAVHLGMDVDSAVPVVDSLQTLYQSAVAAEHLAEVSS